jgi:hypothetical protein
MLLCKRRQLHSPAAAAGQVRINPDTPAEVAAAHRPPDFIRMWQE